MGLALPDRRIQRISAVELRLAPVEHARRLVQQLSLRVAEDLLEAAVAAQDPAILEEGDADHRVLEQRVLLAHQPLHRLVGAPPLRDVLEHPDVALVGLTGFHRTPGEATPEARAVGTPQPLLARVHAPGVELGVAARSALEILLGEVHVTRVGGQPLAGPQAEQFLEAPVAARHLALAHDGDTHRSIVQQRLLLEHQALDLLVGTPLFGDVLDHPHRALCGVGRVDRARRAARPDDAAVLSAPLSHLLVGLSGAQHLIGTCRGVAILVIVGVDLQRRLPGQLAGHVAIHLLVAPVATRDAPVLDEGDAHRDRLEDRLLFAQHAIQLARRALPVGDVLGNPDRALLGRCGIDAARDDARQERRAVATAHLPFDVELLAGSQARHGDRRHGVVAVLPRVNDLAGLADQLVRSPAEHLGELRVAQEELAVAREGDAYRGIGQHGLVLEQGVAGAPGIAAVQVQPHAGRAFVGRTRCRARRGGVRGAIVQLSPRRTAGGNQRRNRAAS